MIERIQSEFKDTKEKLRRAVDEFQKSWSFKDISQANLFEFIIAKGIEWFESKVDKHDSRDTILKEREYKDIIYYLSKYQSLRR